MTIEPPTLQLGDEGDACAECGAALATDQRYCLNCGAARAEPRLSFQRFLRPAGGAQAASRPAAAGAGGAVATGLNQNATVIFAILAIALLGVMLLLGVLIGKDDGTATIAAAPATTTTAAAPAPAETSATETADAAAKGKGGKGAAADKAIPGQGDVVQGGSGSTEGIPTADTNSSALENAKNGPDVVATGGDKAELDPTGPAGGGSDAVCIGC